MRDTRCMQQQTFSQDVSSRRVSFWTFCLLRLLMLSLACQTSAVSCFPPERSLVTARRSAPRRHSDRFPRCLRGSAEAYGALSSGLPL